MKNKPEIKFFENNKYLSDQKIKCFCLFGTVIYENRYDNSENNRKRKKNTFKVK